MYGALYPGQGSQHLGMGKFLHENFKSTKELFEEASDKLHTNFKNLCFNSDENTLKITTNTQPCLLLVSFASFTVLKNTLGLDFSYLAGHSVGEYGALASSQVLSFTEALNAVQVRANNMLKAPQGGMTAIMGLNTKEILDLCTQATKATQTSISPANINSPGQIVISGELAALTWVQKNKEQLFVNKKWRAIALKVSSAFHSPLMKKTEQAMTKHLNTITFNEAKNFILPNANPSPTKNAKELKTLLGKQICSPVEWEKTMDQLKKNQIKICVEVGPGTVLSGLMKKTYPEIKVYPMNSLKDVKSIEINLCK